MIEVNWRLLSELHEVVNSCAIRAEELSDNYYANLQIIKEERDAYSHFCSALKSEDNEKQKFEFDSALVHQYRALYDSLDWLAVVYRQQLKKILRFKRKKASKLDFDVYQLINEYSEAVAHNRINKDMVTDCMSKCSGITSGVQAYIKVLDSFNELYQKILSL